VKYWLIWQTTAGIKVVPWGLPGDRNVASDYDGDGKTDPAVWRSSTNGETTDFYILESQTNTYNHKAFFAFIFSSPMHQDYNGDGKTDTAVTTGEINQTLSVRYSAADGGFNSGLPPQSFGIRLGDMDGDGRAEKSSRTFDNPVITMTNHETGVSRSVRFGLLDDLNQMADFDGDGIGDLTVWRPSDGTWWWIRSSDNVVNAAQWGIGSEFPYVDAPVPADYDGDGKTDLAIWRRGTAQSPQSYYWINGSQNGVMVFQWGTTTDSAVSY
jgi:hypothetical protein